MPAAIDPAAVRVTMQYWRGDVRICELECRGQALGIRVTRAEAARWVFEAHSDHTADAIVVAGSGATRSAALTDLASTWSAQAPTLGLHTFDWKAVADVLRTVNVID